MHSSLFLSSLLNAVLDFRIRVIKNEKELGRGEAFVRGEKRGLFKKRGEEGGRDKWSQRASSYFSPSPLPFSPSVIVMGPL